MIRDEDRELAKAIGARARALRQRAAATQEEVAEQVDLSPQVYARMEQGRVLPSIRTLVRLAEALQASAGALLDGEEAPGPGLAMKVVESPTRHRGRPKAAAPAADFELNAIQRYARLLDPATRGHVLSLMKRLAARE
jgi:transcriptional regulator with XRE-family HTH domain